MTDFVDYEPNVHSARSDESVKIRPVESADADGLAAAMAVRGGTAEEYRDRALRLINRLDVLLIAETDGVPVGWCGIQKFSIHPDAEPEWLIAGLTVVPELRRRGIAARLLGGVLDATAGSAPNEPIFSVINARNLASIDLHQQLGFSEVGRAATFARIDFTGGEGILLRCSRSPDAYPVRDVVEFRFNV
ncbi:MAG: GNAT family N-acetyltransferase [Actinobacteria bacterium]|nr:GNAT family N-acetyltransferase [Actinomycetota bacterium]